MLEGRHLRIRIAGRLARARREGLWPTLRDMLGFMASGVFWAALLPVSVPLHLLGFRRLTVVGSRIGHLAGEVDCFLKKRAMGELPAGRRYFLSIPSDRVANPHLLRYWRMHLPVVSHPVLARMAETASRWLVMREDVSGYLLRLNMSAEIYAVSARWGRRAPVLALTDDDRQFLRDGLKALGIPGDAWFVCVHVREAGFSPQDDWAHAHRNARVETAIPAMREVVRRGGWCVRMGDPTMTPLPALDGVVDYARHPIRSPRLDVLLCASCRFFVGNTSGPAFISAAFGVPSALGNMIPTSAMGLLPDDLSIPKPLWSIRERRYLTLPEIMASEVSRFRYATLYEEAGIRAEESSAEDMADMVAEMCQRLEGAFVETDEDRHAWRTASALLAPGHYSYGTPARMAATFLRRHRELLSGPDSGE